MLVGIYHWAIYLRQDDSIPQEVHKTRPLRERHLWANCLTTRKIVGVVRSESFWWATSEYSEPMQTLENQSQRAIFVRDQDNRGTKAAIWKKKNNKLKATTIALGTKTVTQLTPTPQNPKTQKLQICLPTLWDILKDKLSHKDLLLLGQCSKHGTLLQEQTGRIEETSTLKRTK